MMLLPRSAAYRIAILSALAFTLAVLATGLAVYLAAHSAVGAQLDEGIRQAQVGLMADYADDGFNGLVESVARQEQSRSNTLAFAIFDRGGRKIAGDLDVPRPRLGWSRIDFRHRDEGTDHARALATRLGGGNTLVVAADLKPVQAIDRAILTAFGLGFLAMALIGILFALVLGGYLKRRLDRIAVGSRAFAAGDLAGRAQVGRRGDEFDELATALNAMLDRIALLLGNLQQVTSDLAHDLRTPLSHLRSHLERLRTVPADSRDEMIEVAIEKSDEMLGLFAAILRIAELEQSDLKRHFEMVDVNELVRDLGETHEPLAEDSRHELTVRTCARPGYILGDRELLAQALINLVQNALRHTPSGSRVELGATVDDEELVLFVRDNGPGVGVEDRGRILDRFVRLEAARSTPGNGLGLSLVKAIAEAHGARLELRDAGPGLEARIVFAKGDA